MADKPVRADKATAVAELTESFRASSATLLTEYRGLTVAQLKELRRTLGRTTTYAVTKNTLAKRAATDAGVSGLDELFTGPTALAFVAGDPVEAAKGLREFAKTHPLLVIKGGVFEGKALSADEVRKLADLESREVLLAKLAGAMKASMSKAAATFQAPLTQAARLAQALADKRAAEGGAPAEASVAMAVQGGGGGGGAAAPVEEEKDEFDVVLEADGGKKIQVIKVVRELTGLGLKEAKDLVEAAPKPVLEKANKEAADKARAKLEAEGAKVSLR